MPASHASHAAAPTVLIEYPNEQFVQVLASAGEYVPAPQFEQPVEPSAEKVPASQAVQDEAPTSVLYFPATQKAQIEVMPSP